MLTSPSSASVIKQNQQSDPDAKANARVTAQRTRIFNNCQRRAWLRMAGVADMMLKSYNMVLALLEEAEYLKR